MSKYRVTEIDWDSDSYLGLPEEVVLEAETPDDISDVLSNEYGFLVNSCWYEEIP